MIQHEDCTSYSPQRIGVCGKPHGVQMSVRRPHVVFKQYAGAVKQALYNALFSASLCSPHSEDVIASPWIAGIAV